MAALILAGNSMQLVFENYAGQKLGRVEGVNAYAEEIRKYYGKKLNRVKDELENAHDKLEKAREKKSKDAEDLRDQYRKLLFKREKFRMEKYGFRWSSTGWLNIDRGTIPKDWGPQTLTVDIENGGDKVQVYVYVIYPGLQSIYRLNTTDRQHFYVGNKTEKKMLMPKLKEAVVFAVAYQADAMQMSTEKFITGEQENISIKLQASNKESIALALAPYDDYNQENRIAVDLEYMQKFEVENQRQQALQDEAEFLAGLWHCAHPCEDKEILGEQLFALNCAACHSLDKKMIGPALRGLTTKHQMGWLVKWVQDNQALRESGDPAAIAVFKEYNGSLQPKFSLSRAEIEAVFAYADAYRKPLP